MAKEIIQAADFHAWSESFEGGGPGGQNHNLSCSGKVFAARFGGLQFRGAASVDVSNFDRSNRVAGMRLGVQLRLSCVLMPLSRCLLCA